MPIIAHFSGGTVTFKAGEYGAEPSAVDYGLTTHGLKKIAPADEYWFTYWVRPLPGWIEGLGGKLPGLAGGHATSGGADVVPHGWSDRCMWGTMRGGLRDYRYSQDRLGDYGDYYPFIGDRFLDVGEWTRMMQYVKVNDPGHANGQLRWWVNDLPALVATGITWRGVVPEDVARVDKVRMSIFRGGGSDIWAVDKDTKLEFSDFYVLDCAPLKSDNPDELPRCKAPPRPERELAAVLTLDENYEGSIVSTGGKDQIVIRRVPAE